MWKIHYTEEKNILWYISLSHKLYHDMNFRPYRLTHRFRSELNGLTTAQRQNHKMFPPSPSAGRLKPAQTGADFQQLNHGGQFQTLTVLRIRFRPNSDETWRKVLWLTAAGSARLHSSLSCSQPQFQIFNFNVRKNNVHTWLHSSSNLHRRLKLYFPL